MAAKIKKRNHAYGRRFLAAFLVCMLALLAAVPANAAVRQTGVQTAGGYTYYIDPVFDMSTAQLKTEDAFSRVSSYTYGNASSGAQETRNESTIVYTGALLPGQHEIGGFSLLFQNQASDAGGVLYDVRIDVSHITYNTAKRTEGPVAVLANRASDGSLVIAAWTPTNAGPITASGNTVTDTPDYALSAEITTTILRHDTEIPAKGNVLQGYRDLDERDTYTQRVIDHTLTNNAAYYPANNTTTGGWPEFIELLDGIRSDIYLEPDTYLRSNPAKTWFWGSRQDSDSSRSGLSFLGNASGYTVRWRGATDCETKLFLAHDRHVITAAVEGGYPGGGYVSHKGERFYYPGADAVYTVRPNDGFYIESMTVDGVSVTPSASHTFSNIQEDHSIRASFRPFYTVTYEWEGEHPDLSVPAQTAELKDGDSFTVDTAFHDGYTYTETNGILNGVVYPQIQWTFQGWDASGTLEIHENHQIKGTWKAQVDWPGATVPIYNINTEYTGTARIQKNGKRIGAPDAAHLEGAEFKAYEYSVTDGAYSENPYATAVWDAGTGTYYFASLSFTYDNQGRYRIVETGAPDGYAIGYTEDIDITKTKNTELTGTKSASDDLNHVTVKKVDGNTLQPLEGAEFTLDIDPSSPNYDGGTDYAETAIAMRENGELIYGGDIVTSDADGEIHLYGLWNETVYELVEVTAPEGDYGLNDTVFHIVTDSRGYALCPEDETASLTNAAPPAGPVKDYAFMVSDIASDCTDIPLYKYDEKGDPIGGAVFVLHIEHPAGQAHDHTVTTDDNGYALFEKVYNGEYELYEVKTAEGYSLLPYAVNVRVERGQADPETIIIRNNKLVSLSAGGTGRILLYIAGAMALAAIGAGLWYVRRRKMRKVQ